MTNHNTYKGRCSGLPKKAVNALKKDLREAGYKESLKTIEGYISKVEQTTNPKRRKRFQRFVDWFYHVADAKLEARKTIDEYKKPFFDNLKGIISVINIYVNGAFDHKGNWKEGVKQTFKDTWQDRDDIYEILKYKKEIARLSQIIYPNSNKTAPHASWILWDGQSRKPQGSNYIRQWSAWCIWKLGIKDLWNFKPIREYFGNKPTASMLKAYKETGWTKAEIDEVHPYECRYELHGLTKEHTWHLPYYKDGKLAIESLRPRGV